MNANAIELFALAAMNDVQGMDMVDKTLAGVFGVALLLMIRSVGLYWGQETKSLRTEVTEMTKAVAANTAAQRESTAAQDRATAQIREFCEQMRQAHVATIASQQSLTREIIADQKEQTDAIREELAQLGRKVDGLGRPRGGGRPDSAT